MSNTVIEIYEQLRKIRHENAEVDVEQVLGGQVGSLAEIDFDALLSRATRESQTDRALDFVRTSINRNYTLIDRILIFGLLGLTCGTAWFAASSAYLAAAVCFAIQVILVSSQAYKSANFGRTLSSPTDVFRIGAPVLGVAQQDRMREESSQLAKPLDDFGKAYYRLLEDLQASSANPLGSIFITSSESGRGANQVAIQLANSCREAGINPHVINYKSLCDIASKPKELRVEHVVSHSAGGVAIREIEKEARVSSGIAEIRYESTDVNEIRQAIRERLSELRSNCDIVIVTADGSVLHDTAQVFVGRCADRTLLAEAYNVSRDISVANAYDRLRNAGCRMSGIYMHRLSRELNQDG